MSLIDSPMSRESAPARSSARAASRWLPRIATALLLACGSGPIHAQAFTENFDDITLLAGNGWFLQNNSAPVGITSWFQGTSVAGGGPFDAYNGAANSYIGANFNSTTGSSGIISTWLLTPNRTFRNGDVLVFYTRKPATPSGGTDYPDRLEVRLSTNGASTNVGAAGNNVGDFTTLLLSVNPTLVAGGYPYSWTQYTITLAGLPAPTSGRVAFRYFVTGAGPTGANSDYIGIDNVVYTPYTCPALTVTGTPGAGTFGQAYNASFSQTGALGAPSYAITSGALPGGLTLSSAGTISGTPTATGTFNFTVTVSDASGCSGSAPHAITIAPAPQTLTFPAQSETSRWFESGDTFPIDPLASSAMPNSGMPIVYSSLTPGVCTVSTATVTMVSAGTCRIAANQAGDANYSAAAQVDTEVLLVTPTQADLRIEKTANIDRARIGDTVVYTITVHNDGPANASNVAVLDLAPDRLDAASVVWQCIAASATTCPTPDSDQGDLDITLAAFPRYSSLTFELLGEVIAATNPEDNYVEFHNTALVALPGGSGLTDPPENNQSTASVLVIPDAIFADGFENQP